MQEKSCIQSIFNLYTVAENDDDYFCCICYQFLIAVDKVQLLFHVNIHIVYYFSRCFNFDEFRGLQRKKVEKIN